MKYLTTAILFSVFTANMHAANPGINVPDASLEILDTDTKAEGVRKSNSELTVINTLFGTRKAELTVALNSGEFCHGYPKWSGDGVVGADGSTSASYSGNGVSTVTVDYGPNAGSDSITISRIIPTPASLEIQISETGKLSWIYDGLQKFIRLFNDTEDLTGGASAKASWERVDKYNDAHDTAFKIKAEGSITATLKALEKDFDIPIPVIPGLFIEIEVGVEAAGLTGTLSGEYDGSKAEPGEIKGKLSLGATVFADIGPEAKIPGVEVDLDVGLASRLEVGGSLSSRGNKLYGDFNYGITNTILSFNGVIAVELWGDIFDTEFPFISYEKELEGLKLSDNIEDFLIHEFN